VGHLVDAAGSLVKDKKRAVEEKIKDAGGLGNFLAGGLSGIGISKPHILKFKPRILPRSWTPNREY
jgi:hypothetical protein